MKYVGAHVSTAGGVFNAPLRAKEIGAKACAFFTKNQRRWFSDPYTSEEIAAFKKNLRQVGILPEWVLAHGGYLINLGHPDAARRKQSVTSFIDEIHRCEQLGVEKIVIHPGSHLKAVSEKVGLNYIASSLNEAIAATNKVILAIENTAGQGGNLGYNFQHLADIIGNVIDKNRIGICLDTCHLFAAGYDFTTKEKYEEVWQSFNDMIGFDYLVGMHLNDSKGKLGSWLDRHDSIGKGEIGLAPFKFLMQDPRFDNRPLILETVDPEIWALEIKLLYSFEL